MQSLRTSTLLRAVLFIDAATCIAMGLLLIPGSASLAGILGLPATLLLYSGISLVPFAACLLYLAKREGFSHAAVWTVIVLNVLWAVDSLLLLLTPWVAPSGIGYAFVIVQALGVAGLASLEYIGLKKSATASVVTA